MARAVLALTSGRSGTRFLHEVIRRNATNVLSRHEPYGWNPSMFGRPIYDYAVGDTAAVRRLVERKAAIVRRCPREVYVETSHALLKSYFDLAAEFFPDLRLVHLVRSVAKVAKSEANREALLHRWRLPLRNYRGGDARPYFRWSLTGKEPIFQTLDAARLSRFQWYVVQWIEIENRARQFLDRYDKQAECFTLHGPDDLNQPQRLGELFDFLGLARRQREIVVAGRRNETPGMRTLITPGDYEELEQVLEMIPQEYLQIFYHLPYVQWDWATVLRR